jgi:hypothetical protein
VADLLAIDDSRLGKLVLYAAKPFALFTRDPLQEIARDDTRPLPDPPPAIAMKLPRDMPRDVPRPLPLPLYTFRLKINDSSEESQDRVVRFSALSNRGNPATLDAVAEVVGTILAAGRYPSDVKLASSRRFVLDPGVALLEDAFRGRLRVVVTVYKFVLTLKHGPEIMQRFPVIFDTLPAPLHDDVCATPSLVTAVTMAAIESAVSDNRLGKDVVYVMQTVLDVGTEKCRWLFRDHAGEYIGLDKITSRQITGRTLGQLLGSNRIELECMVPSPSPPPPLPRH